MATHKRKLSNKTHILKRGAYKKPTNKPKTKTLSWEEEFEKGFYKLEENMLDAQGMSGGISPDYREAKDLFRKLLNQELRGLLMELDEGLNEVNWVDYKPSRNVTYKAIKWDDLFDVLAKIKKRLEVG